MALHPLQSTAAVNASFRQLHTEGDPTRDEALGNPVQPQEPVSNRRGTVGHLVNSELPGLVHQAMAAGSRGDTDKTGQYLNQINSIIEANYDALSKAASYRGQDRGQAAVAAAAQGFINGDYMRNDENPEMSLYALSDPESDRAKQYRSIQHRAGTSNSLVIDIEENGDPYTKSLLYASGFGKYAYNGPTHDINKPAAESLASEQQRLNALTELHSVMSHANEVGGEAQAYFQLLDYLKSSYGGDKLSVMAERERLIETAERLTGEPITMRNIGQAIRDMRSLHDSFYRTDAMNPVAQAAASRGTTTPAAFSVNSVYSSGAATRDDDLYTDALRVAQRLASRFIDPSDSVSYRNFLQSAMSEEFCQQYRETVDSNWLVNVDPVTKDELLADMLQHIMFEKRALSVPVPDQPSLLVKGRETTKFAETFFDSFDDTDVGIDDAGRPMSQAEADFFPTVQAIKKAVVQVLPTFFQTGVDGNPHDMFFALLTNKEAVDNVVAITHANTGIDEDYLKDCVTGITRQLVDNPEGRLDLAQLSMDMGAVNSNGNNIRTLFETRQDVNARWIKARETRASEDLADAVAVTYTNDGIDPNAKVLDLGSGGVSNQSLLDLTCEIERESAQIQALSDLSPQVDGITTKLIADYDKAVAAREPASETSSEDEDDFSDPEKKKKSEEELSNKRRVARQEAVLDALGLRVGAKGDFVAFRNPAAPSNPASHIGAIYQKFEQLGEAGSAWHKNVAMDLKAGLETGDKTLVKSAITRMGAYLSSSRSPSDDPVVAAAGAKLLVKSGLRDLSMAEHLNPKALPPQELSSLKTRFKTICDTLVERGCFQAMYLDAYDTRTGRYRAWPQILTEYARYDAKEAADVYAEMCKLTRVNKADARVALFRAAAQQAELAQTFARAQANINDEWQERQEDGLSTVAQALGYLNTVAGTAASIYTGVDTGWAWSLAPFAATGLGAGLSYYSSPGSSPGSSTSVDLTSSVGDPLSEAVVNTGLTSLPNMGLRGERNNISYQQQNDPWLRRAFGTGLESGSAGWGVGNLVAGKKGGIIGAISGFLTGFTSSLAMTAYRNFTFDDPSIKHLTTAVDSCLSSISEAVVDPAQRKAIEQQIGIGLADINRKTREVKDYDEKAAFQDKLNLWKRTQQTVFHYAQEALGPDGEKDLFSNDGEASSWIRDEKPTEAELAAHLTATSRLSNRGLARNEQQAARYRAITSKRSDRSAARVTRFAQTLEKDYAKSMKTSSGNTLLLARTTDNFVRAVTANEAAGVRYSSADLQDFYRQVLIETSNQIAEEAAQAEINEYRIKEATKQDSREQSINLRARLQGQRDQNLYQLRAQETKARQDQDLLNSLMKIQATARVKENPEADLLGELNPQ